MIKTIDNSNTSEAIDFLVQGFPDSSRKFWESGILKIQNSIYHRSGDIPIGYTLHSKGEIVGIGLTPTRIDSCYASGHETKVVSLSSWYVVENQRWKLPLLLRAMMADKEAIYTDLTPAPDMQILLQKIGFSPLNDGVRAVATPIHAFIGSRRYNVKVWLNSEDYGFSKRLLKLLQDHFELGCLIFIIEKEGHNYPLVLKLTQVKGVKVAQIIFLEDRTLLEGALAQICKKLFMKGCLAIFIDCPVTKVNDARISGLRFEQKYRKYFINGTSTEVINNTYSELVYFDN